MRYSRLSLLACLLPALSMLPAFALETSDPAAMPDARRILGYLASLPGRADQRVLSGQFIGYAYQYRSGYAREVSGLRNETGKWVAMVSTDFAFTSIPYREYCDALAGYWDEGHLVSISYHIPRPAGAFAGLAQSADWLKRLDEIAERLGYLQSKGVVVLWRPFHEMNGDWFWWGRQDPAAFTALWRHMHRYLTVDKGLHNLLWVYAPDDSRDKAAAYYPGDAFADIVGLDNYNNNAAGLELASYAEMTALGKPFGLTEFSPKTSTATPEKADFRVLVEGGLKTRYPKIAFFLAWDREWGMAYNENSRSVLQDAWIVDRESLAWKAFPLGLAARRPVPQGADGGLKAIRAGVDAAGRTVVRQETAISPGSSSWSWRIGPP
jgi:mannan endo-1,4-beta-mannosidase